MTKIADAQEDCQAVPSRSVTSQCVDWYSVGEARVVECNGVRVVVRLVGRKGRRSRIVIEAPAGAIFRSVDGDEARGA